MLAIVTAALIVLATTGEAASMKYGYESRDSYKHEDYDSYDHGAYKTSNYHHEPYEDHYAEEDYSREPSYESRYADHDYSQEFSYESPYADRDYREPQHDSYDEDYYGGDAYSEEPSYNYEPRRRPRSVQNEGGEREGQFIVINGRRLFRPLFTKTITTRTRTTPKITITTSNSTTSNRPKRSYPYHYADQEYYREPSYESHYADQEYSHEPSYESHYADQYYGRYKREAVETVSELASAVEDQAGFREALEAQLVGEAQVEEGDLAVAALEGGERDDQRFNPFKAFRGFVKGVKNVRKMIRAFGKVFKKCTKSSGCRKRVKKVSRKAKKELDRINGCGNCCKKCSCKTRECIDACVTYEVCE